MSPFFKNRKCNINKSDLKDFKINPNFTRSLNLAYLHYLMVFKQDSLKLPLDYIRFAGSSINSFSIFLVANFSGSSGFTF